MLFQEMYTHSKSVKFLANDKLGYFVSSLKCLY